MIDCIDALAVGFDAARSVLGAAGDVGRCDHVGGVTADGLTFAQGGADVVVVLGSLEGQRRG